MPSGSVKYTPFTTWVITNLTTQRLDYGAIKWSAEGGAGGVINSTLCITFAHVTKLCHGMSDNSEHYMQRL